MEMYLIIWDTQEYVVQSIHTNFTLNNFTFDSCVTINQNYKSNLLQYENTEEIYSLGLGLVYKEEIVTQINNGDKNDILHKAVNIFKNLSNIELLYI